MIKHIVMWRLRDDLPKPKSEVAAEIKRILEDLKGKIEVIRAIEVGINVKPSDGASDVALYSEFATLDDLEIYQKHPEHLRVAGYIGEVRSERRVVDYEA
ncbi:MAG: Dabb family protein [Deltaproteobacteria bacterium]